MPKGVREYGPERKRIGELVYAPRSDEDGKGKWEPAEYAGDSSSLARTNDVRLRQGNDQTPEQAVKKTHRERDDE